MIISNPTSDYSDNGKSGKSKENQNRVSKMEVCSYSSSEFSKTHTSSKQNSTPAGNKYSSQTTQASSNKTYSQRTHESEKQDTTDKKASKNIVFQICSSHESLFSILRNDIIYI